VHLEITPFFCIFAGKRKRMNLSPVLIFILIFIATPAAAQNDTVSFTEQSETSSFCIFVIPSILVSYGIITQFAPALQNFDKTIDGCVLQSVHQRYVIDDYLQYVPYVGIYAPDLFGIKAKHTLIDRTLVLGASMMICASAVQIPKHLTGVTRPDGSNTHSFPSGHTATAFLGAHILYREYKETALWMGMAGYGMAAITGAMRVINRKHWFSDVIAGAGIGIISVELAYLMLPVWHRLFKIDCHHSPIINPVINQTTWGLGVTKVF
jgi:membrane-associated phospholipid phosphatase